MEQQTQNFEKLGTPKQHLKNSIRDMNEFYNLEFEEQYAISLANILQNGTISKDRTNVGTKRIQGQKIVIDLTKEFPILQGKKMNFKNALIEMMWIMTGKNDLKFLKDNGVNYWDSWVKEDGTFGPIYGPQMRNFGTFKIHTTDFPGTDQLKDTILQLRNNPDSRRIIVDLWNPNDLKAVKLPPCHFYYQICSFINKDGIRVMDLHVHQRSADSFIGVPYDFMLFAIYLNIISYFTGIKANKIHCTFNDYHMYLNHEEQIKLYLENYYDDKQEIISNNIKPTFQLHTNFQFLNLDEDTNKLSNDEYFKDFERFMQHIIENEFNDLQILNYNSYPFIKTPVAV